MGEFILSLFQYFFDMKINFQLPYDNEAAHSQIKLMMKRRLRINIKFMENSDNIPCVWVEAINTRHFMYQLTPQSWKWLWEYLKNSDDEDFGIFPMKVNPYEGDDFQFDTLKSLIDMGYAIQFVPTLRKTSYFVSALLPLNNGKIFFRMRRTDTIMNYIETIKVVA